MTFLEFLEWAEFLSYIVTIIGLPFAILVFYFEQRKERDNEEEEIYQRLSDEYAQFLELVLVNSDIKLRSQMRAELNDDQNERRQIIFEMLISLFERAYILSYDDNMNKRQLRRWKSWEDYMREWCRREDFRKMLPTLLNGEDEDFSRYIENISREETAKLSTKT